MKVIKIFIFIALVLLVSNSIVLVRDYIKTPKNIKHFLFKEGDILEGVSTGPSEITVDFSKQISTGSPLIFGGAHGPRPGQTDAWDKIADAGFTAVRRDLFIDQLVPITTIEEYKANKNGIQDIRNWNPKGIADVRWYFVNAKKRGMKVVAIMDYTPGWLTYSSPYGVPRDWDVYKDIVKKSYILFYEYIDYIEIWNEPDLDFFMNLKGSPYTKTEAYKLLFKNAHEAIREAERELGTEKRVPIGGPAVYTPTDHGFVASMLSDEYFRNNIGFFSYHNYEHIPEPSWHSYKSLLTQRGKEDIPMAITEWNYWPKMKEPNKYIIGQEGVVYAGRKLVQYLSNNIRMANYFSLQPIEPNSRMGNYGYLGVFYWKNGIAELTPVAKTFRLLSKSMGLGKGESRVFSVIGDQNSVETAFDAVGFVNTFGQHGLALVNDSDSEKYVHVVFNDIGKEKMQLDKISLDVYIASAEYDGGKAVDRIYLKPDENNTVSFTLLLPPQSVAGIIQPRETDWRELIKTYIP